MHSSQPHHGIHNCQPIRSQVSTPTTKDVQHFNIPCRASVVRYPNGTFEARIHLPGTAAHIDVVPHDNFILVTGSLATRARIDSDGKPSILVFTDQPCGVFGRDIPVNLTAGTEVRDKLSLIGCLTSLLTQLQLIVLSAHQDCDDYVVRYTIRNSVMPRANCADSTNATAGMAKPMSPVDIQGHCGGINAGIAVGPGGYVRPQAGSCSVPPAILGRGPGVYGDVGYGHGYAGYQGYAGYNHGFAHTAGIAHHGPTRFVFHANGGATF